jgi:hypothetical protein
MRHWAVQQQLDRAMHALHYGLLGRPANHRLHRHGGPHVLGVLGRHLPAHGSLGLHDAGMHQRVLVWLRGWPADHGLHCDN